MKTNRVRSTLALVDDDAFAAAVTAPLAAPSEASAPPAASPPAVPPPLPWELDAAPVAAPSLGTDGGSMTAAVPPVLAASAPSTFSLSLVDDDAPRAPADGDAAPLLAAGGLGAIISPPVMGAAAFLIAEYLKIGYLEVLESLLNAFYREKAHEKLLSRVRYWERQSGLQARGVRIRHFQSRWASCNAQNVLEFHPRVMELPASAQDYVTGIEAVAPYTDYITINISSPNTPGLRDLQGRAALDNLLGRLAEARGDDPTPVFLKIAPDLTTAEIALIVEASLDHRIDALIVSNTTLARPAAIPPALAAEAGGLSGAPVLEASNQVIRQLRSALGSRYPIIGVGGILSGEDAVSKIRAGADVVQIYSGLIYRGPCLVPEAARAIAQLR